MKRVPSVQQTAARVGPCVEAGGKTYRLGFNDQDAKSRLEELVRRHVIREALREKRALGGQDGEDYFEAVQDRLDAGHYATLARGWTKALASPEGSVLFLLSFLQEYHPDMTPAAADDILKAEPEQCRAAIRVIAPDFLKAVLLQKGAKNGPELDAALGEVVRAMDGIWGPATD